MSLAEAADQGGDDRVVDRARHGSLCGPSNADCSRGSSSTAGAMQFVVQEALDTMWCPSRS
ncbi:hypothetical protein FHX81_1231 [Saccharothrix saharensis]|uniref:Uncharacterized protein n=1 Tax=Saccharothrix saharensis TaxID=571190 RepID=A0A543J803_9PSEU|nr:hypothetical protein FHX81_1231 [Saccharothrix saharensis]